MRTSVRVILVIPAILSLGLGLGFYLQLSWAVNLWPWPDSYLSYVFISSYATAIGSAILWVVLSGSLGAAKGGFVNLAVASAGMAAYALQVAQGNTAVQTFAFFGVGACLVFVVSFLLMWRVPMQDGRRTPLPVRISFIIFVIMLVFAGVSLVLKSPTIFPWSLRPESSVIFGWAFLGAACYFAYSLLFPRWDNTGGQLLGFLGYDLILIVPFLRHFANIAPDHTASLIVYVIVIIYSGALAVYYLFINRSTRRWALALQPATEARRAIS
jgi:hypothetical protein